MNKIREFKKSQLSRFKTTSLTSLWETWENNVRYHASRIWELMRMWKIEIKTLFSGRVLSFFVRSFSADRRKKKKAKIPLKNWTRKHFVPNSIAWLWLLNSLDNGLIMILQSTMQPGHIISAWRYLGDDRTNHARHRDLVHSSSRWITSTIFLTSLNGIGSSSSLLCTPFLATHTCDKSKSQVCVYRLFTFADFQKIRCLSTF